MGAFSREPYWNKPKTVRQTSTEWQVRTETQFTGIESDRIL